MQVEDPETQKLTLRLMDDESVEKSEYVGSVALSIKEVNLTKFFFLFFPSTRLCFYYLKQQPLVELCVVGCGSKNEHQKTCVQDLKEIGLWVQNLLTILG